ncbi:MAG: MBL fold metallo-hydrolase [Gammaproteobacteria bacterium]|nr:MBL fold metallo-hydrolase [Gammaproteobacteria bacterium]
MVSSKKLITLAISSFFLPLIATYAAPVEPSDAPSAITQQMNAGVLQQLPFSNTEDFVSARRGLVSKPDSLIIKNANGSVVWNIDQYTHFEGLNTPAPNSVNPALWRLAQLNSLYGLFKVTEHVYQVRGYDLSVMSIIEGKTGYIIVDPLASMEPAKAAMDLVYKTLGKKPIIAVIYTHSHLDHFGGVKGVITQAEVSDGHVKVIAPEGFMEESISENIVAGNAMTRRAMYMYGSLLPVNAMGQVDAGIGKATSSGTPTLIPPTDIIKKTGQTMVLDGVKFIFQYTPGTEAPAEMNFYLPQFHALCIAENAVHSMHNLYSLRGAKVRNAENWVKYLNQTITLYGKESDVLFASHTWPVWGNQNVIQYLENQRDMYKYIHDQTLRLANKGETMDEIAEQLKLPPTLANLWYTQGYYGSISQNAKAVYQMYLGWYNGNPADLNPLPPVETAIKTVDYMGGAAIVIQKAQHDYDQGNYRWVAQIMNDVVMADPNNQQAENLLARAYEQLGYQTENATWRNVYLTGALELRKGVNVLHQMTSASPDIMAAMTPEMLFNYMAIRLNPDKAGDKKIILNFILTDNNAHYVLELNNDVLNTFADEQDKSSDATLTLNSATLNKILSGQLSIDDAIKANKVTITGDKNKVNELLSLMDSFNPDFNIVTP